MYFFSKRNQLIRICLLIFLMIMSFGCEGKSDIEKRSSNAPQTTSYDKTPRVLLLLSSAYNSVGPQTLADSYLKQLSVYGLETGSVHVEFLDVSNSRDDMYWDMLSAFLHHKYEGSSFDVIVTVNELAGEFYFDRLSDISPLSPVYMFYGAGTVNLEDTGRNVVSVAQAFDFQGTLELALKLCPQVRKVLVVCGSGAMDKEFQNEALRVFSVWEGELAFQYTNGLNLNQIETLVKSASEDTIIVFSSVIEDKQGNMFVSKEVAMKLAQVSSVPIFGAYDLLLNTGVVGGSMLSTIDDGKRLAQITKDILEKKTTFSEFPQVQEIQMSIQKIIDWNQVKRHGLDLSSLPSDVVLINKPLSIWVQYRNIVIATGIAFASLLIMLSISIYENVKRKRVERRLRLSEDKYKGLIEGLEDAVYSLDSDHVIVAYNKRFLDQTELPLEDWGGLDYAKWTIPGLVDPESYQAFWLNALDSVKSHKTSFTSELTYQLADSSSVTVIEVRLIPILNERGDVELIIGSNRDVTELVLTRKQIQDFLEHENEHLELLVEMKSKELKEATQELYRSERLASLGRLVGGVAHEINTPLGVALTGSSYLQEINHEAVQALQADQFTTAKILDYMENVNEASEIISRNLDRAAKLVSNFRNIAVTQSNGSASLFNLNEHINAMIMSLCHEYKNKRVFIKNYLHEDIFIYDLPSHYTQIITNLIMNSLMHGYVEDEELVITVSGDVSDGCLQMIYKDTGKGISPDHLPNIFEPFFTTARHRGGTGLGLSLLYNIVSERLGGSIQCDSTLGEGTQFTIKIPLEQSFKEDL